MFEKIMGLVKDQVMDTVDKTGVPEDKKEATIETTANSLIEGLKKYATPQNLSQFTSMLGIGNKEGSATDMSQSLESNVVSALTSKVGLNSAMAQKIAMMVIPAVMSLFKKKVDDDNEPGFNIGSLIGSLSSGNGNGSGKVMDLLGNLLKSEK